MSDDGILYLGDLTLTSNTPYYITANSWAYNSSWYRMMQISNVIATCVSGEVEGEPIIHTLDEKYLPNSVKAQADWNVNDENDPSYIKNRTHYSETQELEEVLNIQCESGSGTTLTLPVETIQILIEDTSLERVSVVRDGYVMTSATWESDASDTYGILHYYDENNAQGINLSIFYDDQGNFTGEVNFDYASGAWSDATITIRHENELIHHLNPKYIKDMYHETSSEVFSIENAEFTDGQYINETPFVITDGNTYIVNWDGTEYTCAAYTFSGLPVIGDTSQFGGKGNGEPFYIIYISAENVNLIGALDGSTATHTFSVIKNVVHTIDPKYIKDMYYEEVVTTDISGQEYEITGFADNTHNVTHNLNLPFALGQVWGVKSENESEFRECEVLQAEDGTLYIGTPTVNDFPWYITQNEATINSSYQSSLDVFILTVVCVSGGLSETITHQLDEKYLSILKKNNKEIFSIDNISTGEYETDIVLSEGTYNVIVDDTVMKADFINDGGDIVNQNDLCFIASFDGGIFFGFQDGGTHSVKIEIPVNVVKEEYLPKSVTATPNWNVAEGENGYIKNRTHYKESLELIKGTVKCGSLTACDFDYNKIKVGDTIQVVVNGVEYVTTVRDDIAFNMATSGTQYLFGAGASSIYVGSDYKTVTVSTEFPFVIEIRDGSVLFWHTGTTSDTYTVEAYLYEFHQLDQKYIPDGLKTHWEFKNLVSTFDSSTNKMTPARYYEGIDYLVVVDGIEYITRVQHKHHSTIGLYHSYLGSDAGDVSSSAVVEPPFGLYKHSSTSYPDLNAEEIELDFIHEEHEEKHTVEVYEYDLKKLDEKFLPVTEDDEILEMLMEQDMLLAVTDSDGSILSDENDNILLW